MPIIANLTGRTRLITNTNNSFDLIVLVNQWPIQTIRCYFEDDQTRQLQTDNLVYVSGPIQLDNGVLSLLVDIFYEYPVNELVNIPMEANGTITLRPLA